MRKLTPILLLIILMAGVTHTAHGLYYQYLSDSEMTTFGDRIRFWNGDTLNGPVRTNFPDFAISGCPVFLDLVITPQPGPPDSNNCWPGYYDNWRFNAQPIFIPEILSYYRYQAAHYSWTPYVHYYDPGPAWQMRCRITGSTVSMWTWPLGLAFDSAYYAEEEQFDIQDSVLIFTESPLELMGTNITGDVVIASARTIRLMDDVRVGGPTSGPPQYRVFQNNPNFVTIASEGDIKIANTPANGRNNSAGLGNGQTNPALSDIVITAALFALGHTNANGSAGSFTFENQNDADSGYVFCSGGYPGPDDRGQIFLYGAITQRRRGYTHRSNCNSTGYLKQWVYDERLRTRPNVVIEEPPEGVTTDTLDFGNVPLDATVWDTAEIYLPEYGILGTPMASQPYWAERIPPYSGSHFRVPVRFTPPHVGSFPGVLQVLTSYRLYQIPLRGHGIPGEGLHVIGPQVYPNPFNAVAEFRFALPEAAPVTLKVYDVTGREAATLVSGVQAAGPHRVSWDASALSSGVYFARLSTPAAQRMTKLLLVK